MISFILLLFFNVTYSSTNLIKILAVVENTPITNIDLAKYEKVISARKQTLNINKPSNILEALLEEKILEKYTKEKKFYPDEKEIDDFIQKKIKEQHFTEKTFKSYIEHNGYTENSFREDLKLQKAKATLIERELKNRITISGEEVKEEFSKFTSEPSETISYSLKIKSANTTCENTNKDFSALPSIDFLGTELEASIKKLISTAAKNDIKSKYEDGVCTTIKLIKKTYIENPKYTKLKPMITQRLLIQKVEKEFKNWITEKKIEYFVKVYNK